MASIIKDPVKNIDSYHPLAKPPIPKPNLPSSNL